MTKELKRILIDKSDSLYSLSRRFSAIDARYLDKDFDSDLIITKYTLADQLKVEPNSNIPSEIETESFLIDMTTQEIAVALSHIEIWKLMFKENLDYSLILEDDVYFKYGFNKDVDKIWEKIKNSEFDILFLSYEYVKNEEGELSANNESIISKPITGIWQASGYVLSKRGATKLLNLLPVYGPVDLWMNLMFDQLNVYVAKDPIIVQRLDVPSTNSYSIMPVLSQIGIYTNDRQNSFKVPNLIAPVLVFGEQGSGLTALANALMILGYTCCSDLDKLPELEEENFFDKKKSNIFNAYVNIRSLEALSVEEIINLYPKAKIIYTSTNKKIINNNRSLLLPDKFTDKWDLLCSFLNIEYPAIPYPNIEDDIQFEVLPTPKKDYKALPLKFDTSPWIVSTKNWQGINIKKEKMIFVNRLSLSQQTLFNFNEWRLREDTFPSNLSIFRPRNVTVIENTILQLNFKNEQTSVRSFTSSALVTKQVFLYGKFAVKLRPSNISGIITGVFLHRNSPHQEIDIEFLGKDTSKMLINVFFNPGIEGTKLEYGFRGTPVEVDLGFDASIHFHLYEIEWQSNLIRWYVDNEIVFERSIWDPTPIPNLPMEFNVNLWHSQSKDFAGILDKKNIPTQSLIKEIRIEY